MIYEFRFGRTWGLDCDLVTFSLDGKVYPVDRSVDVENYTAYVTVTIHADQTLTQLIDMYCQTNAATVKTLFGTDDGKRPLRVFIHPHHEEMWRLFEPCPPNS
jgi:hypothetical protein